MTLCPTQHRACLLLMLLSLCSSAVGIAQYVLEEGWCPWEGHSNEGCERENIWWTKSTTRAGNCPCWCALHKVLSSPWWHIVKRWGLTEATRSGGWYPQEGSKHPIKQAHGGCQDKLPSMPSAHIQPASTFTLASQTLNFCKK